jgi:peptide/nickel transport system permease protein
MIKWFLWRRFIITLPVLLGSCFLAFMLIRLGGSDPAAALAGPLADVSEVDRVRRNLGLDQPLLKQFYLYMGQVLHGDLGKSWLSGLPVTEEIADRFPASLELVLVSLVLAISLALPIGLMAARRPNGWADQISRLLSSLLYSMPAYWLALMTIFLVFYRLGWAPAPMGRLPLEIMPPDRITGSYLIDGLLAWDMTVVRAQAAQMVLPVLCLTVTAFAPILKQVRAIAVDIMNSEYIRLARAYGYRPGTILRITARNGLVPIATFIGAEITALLSSVALIELIFAWGGLGQWGLNAIIRGDYAAIQGYVLVLSLFSIGVFMVVDLLVLIAEPRAGRR